MRDALATPNSSPLPATHHWHSIVLIDNAAQIVEAGEFAEQIRGMITVTDRVVGLEAEDAEMNWVTVDRDVSFPEPIMDFVDAFVPRRCSLDEGSLASVSSAFSVSAGPEVHSPIIVRVVVDVIYPGMNVARDCLMQLTALSSVLPVRR
jgi:hypothetical protein